MQPSRKELITTMKSILQIAVLNLAVVCPAFAQTAPPVEKPWTDKRPTIVSGPFGFSAGMTREQIVQLVGRGAVVEKQSQGDFLMLTTAPKPNRTFENYILIISPALGLLKVVAVGVTAQTGDSGSELQTLFADVVAGVSQKYGKPTETRDFCSGNDTECDNSQFWMMSLKDKNRALASLWDFRDKPFNSITAIVVTLKSASISSGYVTVGYEFAGFEQYADSKTAKQNGSY